jgi:hypothetical protein
MYINLPCVFPVYIFSRQDRANVSVYDPVFTTEDVSLFGELQIQLLTENRACPQLIVSSRRRLIFVVADWRVSVDASNDLFHAPL